MSKNIKEIKMDFFSIITLLGGLSFFLFGMNMLSGGSTPLESMPEILRYAVQVSPATQFVSFSQAILYRGAGITVVWKQFSALLLIGSVFFWYSWGRFRKSVM